MFLRMDYFKMQKYKIIRVRKKYFFRYNKKYLCVFLQHTICDL